MGEGGGTAPPAEVAESPRLEESLVLLHSWLRQTVSALLRSGRLLPLAASSGEIAPRSGEITLAPDEERVLLVRCAPPAAAAAGSRPASDEERHWEGGATD